jgi:CxxC-x17-CxxC domain-containing protein
MSYEDKTIVCVDCGAEFTFTADEQQRFAEKGFTNEPKRCKTCRDARKASQTSGNRTGGNSGSSYSSGGGGGRGAYSGGRGGGGGRSFGGGGDRGPRQMFPATCASCGQQTEVPFKPSGSRPVYCRDCFQAQKSSGGSSY